MAEADPYTGQSAGLSSFSERFELITPSDTDDLPHRYKAIVCGENGGAVVVHNHAGDAITLWAVPGAALEGVRPRRILAAGTDANPLIGIL